MVTIEIAETAARCVAVYLPSNRHLTGEIRHSDRLGKDCPVTEGNNASGRTAADYVVPRLTSGLIFARVVS